VTFGEWIVKFGNQYNQYIDELGEMGEDTAQMLFAEAPPEYGNTDVTVEREQNGTGNFIIRATGHDALFLEFGTGVETVVTRQTVQSDVPIEPGSWSKENDGMFAKRGYWYYNKLRYAGTPPLGAMQEACSAMEQWSTTIAGRVFR